MKTSLYQWGGGLGVGVLFFVFQGCVQPVAYYPASGVHSVGQDWVYERPPPVAYYPAGGVHAVRQDWVYEDSQPVTYYSDANPHHGIGQAQFDRNVQVRKRPKKTMVIGDYAVGKEAQEIPVNREISQCYLQLLSGTVSINTVVIRPEKTVLPQSVRLQPGAFHIIELGSKRYVTGFRISANGKGTYRVIVK